MICIRTLASARQFVLLFAKIIFPHKPPLSSRLHRIFILTLGILIVATSSRTEGSGIFFLGMGDPIGLTSSTTDGRGGFTAVQQGTLNLGEPAIAATLSGQEVLNDFRVVVFGIPSTSGNLLFNDFDYRLKFWKSQAYFSDAAPEFEVVLGDPIGVQLVSDGLTNIIPSQPFGNAGAFGNNADTYDFNFDLTSLPLGGPSQKILETPLAAGEWVIAFQSRHNADDSGILEVATSGALVGPLPLLSRDDDIPRGILGGQNPAHITTRWGIAITAKIPIKGDFNIDDSVDTSDLVVWQSSFGIDNGADSDNDGDSDGADFLQWQRASGINPLSFQFGDYNRDNRVDRSDLTLWSTSFGLVGAADSDGDSDSDGTDFLAWQRGFQTDIPASNLIGVEDTNSKFLTTIPEPIGLLLEIEAIFCLTWIRSRKQSLL